MLADTMSNSGRTYPSLRQIPISVARSTPRAMGSYQRGFQMNMRPLKYHQLTCSHHRSSDSRIRYWRDRRREDHQAVWVVRKTWHLASVFPSVGSVVVGPSGSDRRWLDLNPAAYGDKVSWLSLSDMFVLNT